MKHCKIRIVAEFSDYKSVQTVITMKYLLLSPLLIMLGYTKAVIAQSPFVDIPHTPESPHIDGQMNAGEWVDAHIVTLPDSGKVMFARDLQHLYAVIRFPKRGIGSLCVRKNDRVRILHASAALGTATYTQNGDVWQLEESFRFEQQEGDSSGSAKQKRADFLAHHGWVASTVSMDGDETATFLEYKIRLDLFDADRPMLGVAGMLLESNQKLILLPENLDDGCHSPELIRGLPPKQLEFNSSEWLRLTLTD